MWVLGLHEDNEEAKPPFKMTTFQKKEFERLSRLLMLLHAPPLLPFFGFGAQILLSREWI